MQNLATLCLCLLAGNGVNAAGFQLVSKAFESGEAIPLEFLADEDNISPPLEFKGAPAGTKSFALIVDDADAPKGEGTHWLLYDIPAAKAVLQEDISSGDGVSKVSEALTTKPPPPPPGMAGGMGGKGGMAGMMGGMGGMGGMMGGMGGMGGMMGGGMAGLPDGPNDLTAREGTGSFGTSTWSGPRMQPHKEGAVRFKAYALKEKLGLAAGATRAQVLSAMKGKVLGKSNLLGKVGKGGSSKKKKAKQGKKKKKKAKGGKKKKKKNKAKKD